MNARIKDEMLVIELPLEKPRPSSTGKTLLIASTRGVQPSTARVKGKTVSFVANAFIYSDDTTMAKGGKPAATQKKRHGEEEDDEGVSKSNTRRARRVKWNSLLKA